jgi:hypothetical protein
MDYKSLSKNISDKLVAMPHATKEILDLFLEDYKIETLKTT